MKIDEATTLLEELTKVTIPLAETHPLPDNGSQFLRVLEGTYRRNNIRMQSIRLLCQHPITANNALELVRNMTEDVICIEYMLANDKNALADKFFKYEAVQLHDDLEYNRNLGIPINDEQFPDAEERIEEKYAELPNRLKSRKNWAAKSVEEMLEELKSTLDQREIDHLARLYLDGCRKTHFNPYDIDCWLYQELVDHGSEQAMLKVLIFTVAAYVRLTTRYVDEISHLAGANTHHDIANAAKAIFDKFDQAKTLEF